MRKWLLCLTCFILAAYAGAVPIEVPKEVEGKVGEAVAITAKTPGKVTWFSPSPDLELTPIRGTKTVIVVPHKKGDHKVGAVAADGDDVSAPAYTTVKAKGEGNGGGGGNGTGPGSLDPVNAIRQIGFGRSGCTATIIGPRRPDKRWDVLTAAHCVPGEGAEGTIYLPSGVQRPVRVTVKAERPDIAWLILDAGDAHLPYAKLSTDTPPVGTAVWHKGFGVDKPGNVEKGKLETGIDSNGQLRFFLSVSSGDSGGGIMREDTKELLACVCCTSILARPGQMWGGASVTAGRLRPVSVQAEGLMPMPIPLRKMEE